LLRLLAVGVLFEVGVCADSIDDGKLKSFAHNFYLSTTF
jgi:hypothetical protein